MTEPTRCGECDQPLSPGTTICRSCGWDQTTSLARPPRRSLRATLAGGAWRLLVYGLILVLPVVGFLRLRATGPGPDLATTLRWMARGDGGRARELVTITAPTRSPPPPPASPSRSSNRQPSKATGPVPSRPMPP